LLNAVPNNYQWAFAAGSHGSAAPYYVRRVENYIREHARSRSKYPPAKPGALGLGPLKAARWGR
jgi:hypothetical protein